MNRLLNSDEPVEEEKTFIMDLAFKIEVKASEFPDAISNDFIQKMKNKVLSNRETMTLLGIRPEVYEVYVEED